MKTSGIIASLSLAIGLTAVTLTLQAADKKEKAKPYPLKYCPVTGELLDSDPGMKAYSFTHEGQEVKLCCKNCLKDFKKDPATYMKKIEDGSKQKK